MTRASSPPLELFYCYAHKDRTLRDELDIRLAGLRRSDLITTWYDGAISSGASREYEIDAHLHSADIILLLVSPDFIYVVGNPDEGRVLLHLYSNNVGRRAGVTSSSAS
jgi:hypothetical protein